MKHTRIDITKTRNKLSEMSTYKGKNANPLIPAQSWVKKTLAQLEQVQSEFDTVIATGTSLSEKDSARIKLANAVAKHADAVAKLKALQQPEVVDVAPQTTHISTVGRDGSSAVYVVGCNIEAQPFVPRPIHQFAFAALSDDDELNSNDDEDDESDGESDDDHFQEDILSDANMCEYRALCVEQGRDYRGSSDQFFWPSPDNEGINWNDYYCDA